MKSKYGFVVLVDALGARSATIEESFRYLKIIDEIKRDIKIALSATLDNAKSLSGVSIDPNILDDLSPRFFGDTILITYQVKKTALEFDCFIRLCFILETFICRALKLGILFRGSISLGQYINKGNVVLGPAVSDAAAWYEKLDMIGIIATPHTTAAVKSMVISQYPDKGVTDPDVWHCGVFGHHPLKTPTSIETFALNWPRQFHHVGKEGEETAEAGFYRIMRSFPVPVGTESKFQNTERFFLNSYRSDMWKTVFRAKT